MKLILKLRTHLIRCYDNFMKLAVFFLELFRIHWASHFFLSLLLQKSFPSHYVILCNIGKTWCTWKTSQDILIYLHACNWLLLLFFFLLKRNFLKRGCREISVGDVFFVPSKSVNHSFNESSFPKAYKI